MVLTTFIGALATLAAVLVFAWRDPTPVYAPGVPGFYFPLYLLLLLPLWAVVMVSATLFRPAFNAALPRLVRPADLGSANGLVYAVTVSLIVPLTVGSTGIVGAVGSAIALLPTLGLFAVSLVALRLLPGALNPPPSPDRPGFLSDAKEGYVYLWRRRPLLWLTLGGLAVAFFIALAFVELGVYATIWLGVSSPIVYGALAASNYLGIAAGALLIPRLHFEPRSGILIIIFIAGVGLSTAALGLVQSVWLAIPTIFLYGMFAGMINPIFLAVVQATVPANVVGRVLAADEVGSLSMTPVGQYVGGLVTVVAGVQYAYIVAGVGSLFVALGLAGLRSLRDLGFEPGRPVIVPATGPRDVDLGVGGQL